MFYATLFVAMSRYSLANGNEGISFLNKNTLRLKL